METKTEALIDALPKTVFFVLVMWPEPINAPAPLTMPLPPVGFGMPVFSEKELAEAFCDSPNMDVPSIVVERTLEQFVRLGENPPAVAKEHDVENEYLYLIDPEPTHKWSGTEGMGYIVRMDALAEVLRDAGARDSEDE